MRERLAGLAVGALTVVTVLLIAGHGPWAGYVLWQVAPGHGLNVGDLPVLGCWALGTAAILALARR